MSIEVESLHHVSIIVKDLQKAKTFYSDIIGLTEIERPGFGFPGAWFSVGDAYQLHLIVYDSAKAVRGTTDIDSKDGHFAIKVRDYNRTIQHLEAKGVPYRANPASITGWAQIYVTDPDGNVIEFNCTPPVS